MRLRHQETFDAICTTAWRNHAGAFTTLSEVISEMQHLVYPEQITEWVLELRDGQYICCHKTRIFPMVGEMEFPKPKKHE